MLRRIVVLVTVVAMSLVLMAGPASARQPWEKLFGCEGVVPIACPGPLPW